MMRQSYPPDTIFAIRDLRYQGEYFRADEMVTGTATRLPGDGVRIEAVLTTWRDVRIRQPIAVAQAEFELGRPDSALVTLQRAVAAGEDRNAVAQFTLSKGSTLFRAANGTKNRADFLLAMRFLAFADSLRSTPQTKFLLGAAALNVAQSALTDAPKITVKDESCVLSRLGADSIPLARASLEAGQDVSPEATKQFLEYLEVISPYAEKQIAAFCDGAAHDPPKKG